MRFDKSFIKIRKRSMLEIFDLALQVNRQYGLTLFGYLAVGALPLWLLNFLITSHYRDLPIPEYWFSASGSIMLFLVIVESQLGTIFITAFLGKAMFEANPRPIAVVRSVFERFSAIVWVHGVLRLSVPIVGLIAISNFTGDYGVDPAMLTFAILLSLLAVLVRCFRPYISEITILEQTQIFPKDKASISMKRRSFALHSAISADSFSQYVISVLFAALLVQLVYSPFCVFMELMGLVDIENNVFIEVLWPISLWLVAGFLATVRFLSYIDTRIRQEGWEVELKIRSENARLTREVPSA